MTHLNLSFRKGARRGRAPFIVRPTFCLGPVHGGLTVMSRTMVVLRNLALALSMPILVLLVAGAGRAAATQVYSFGGDSFGPGGTGAGMFVEVVSVAVDRVELVDAPPFPAVVDQHVATGGQFGEIAVDNSLGPDS